MIKINDQFKVNFETNEIMSTNLESGNQVTKVEPRIMKVLEILVKNSPSVVLREKLIEEVWDNYGGADDALNQAISHLRKILNDQDKDNRIIETVVKKGYRFVATSSIVSSGSAGWLKNLLKHKTGIQIGLMIALATALAYQVIVTPKTSEEPANFVPVAPPAPESTDTIDASDLLAPEAK
ncbi:MAG: winged helix-turn-helix domain-containing protein [Bacteroidota bacterium]